MIRTRPRPGLRASGVTLLVAACAVVGLRPPAAQARVTSGDAQSAPQVASVPPTDPPSPPAPPAPSTVPRSPDPTLTPEAPPTARPSARPSVDLSCTGTVETVADDPAQAWRGLVVDPVRRLPKGWTPNDLVELPEVGYDGVRTPRVRALVADDLRAMHRAAARAGARFVVVSGYRSEGHQQEVWDRAVSSEGGVDAARAGTAPPGHSEHQLGTTVDVVDPGLPELVEGLVDTPAGRWLAEHAVDHGFVVSYPPGATASTCYKPEPWHLRYVGRDQAALLDGSPLGPRAFLLGHRQASSEPGSPSRAPVEAVAPHATSSASATPSERVSPTDGA